MDDTTFEELLTALREGPSLIETQVRAAPAEGWDRLVEQGEGGWSRRQLLAHIAANDLRQLTRIRVGAGLAEPADFAELQAEGQTDVWNQRQVDLRAGRSVDELLAEMHTHRSELVTLLQSLTPEQRARPMPFRGEPTPLTEMVPALLGHLAFHARQLAP
jgi:hypothetical protein